MSPKIIMDQFKDIQLSRQRRHQLRKQLAGYCAKCIKPRVGSKYCEYHMYQEAKYQQIRRYRRKNELSSS